MCNENILSLCHFSLCRTSALLCLFSLAQPSTFKWAALCKKIHTYVLRQACVRCLCVLAQILEKVFLCVCACVQLCVFLISSSKRLGPQKSSIIRQLEMRSQWGGSDSSVLLFHTSSWPPTLLSPPLRSPFQCSIHVLPLCPLSLLAL